MKPTHMEVGCIKIYNHWRNYHDLATFTTHWAIITINYSNDIQTFRSLIYNLLFCQYMCDNLPFILFLEM